MFVPVDESAEVDLPAEGNKPYSRLFPPIPIPATSTCKQTELPMQEPPRI